MEETAYAKINLALHVRERRPDGYHRIETLFAFAEEGDRLFVEESEALTLQVEGPFASLLGEENLVLRAAEALRSRFSVTRGAALRLDKRLPVAAGIGGGSADAAAALRLLGRWWGLDTAGADLMELAGSLGADVPACLRSETCWGGGRGDELEAAREPALSGTPLLLVNPLVPVPTGPVFAGWDGVDLGPLPRGAALATAQSGRNDLEPSAIAIAPAIREVLDALPRADGTLLVRMSGSGATCYALFESETARDAAAARLADEWPGWWRLATCLR